MKRGRDSHEDTKSTKEIEPTLWYYRDYIIRILNNNKNINGNYMENSIKFKLELISPEGENVWAAENVDIDDVEKLVIDTGKISLRDVLLRRISKMKLQKDGETKHYILLGQKYQKNPEFYTLIATRIK